MPTTLIANFSGIGPTRLDLYTPDTGTITVTEPANNATVRGWYRIESNQLIVQPENGWNYVAQHNTGAADLETSFRITSTHAASISAGMGYVKSRDDYITANANSGSWRRYKRIAGTMTSAAFSTPTAHDPTDVLTVERNGNDIEFYVDGVLVDTYTLTSGEQTVFAGVTTVGMTSRDASVNTSFDAWTAGTTSVAPSIVITDPKKVYAVGTNGTSRAIVFEGTYAGAVGSALEYKLEKETTAGSNVWSIVTNWTDADLETVASGEWEIPLIVERQTTMMRLTVRDKAAPSVVSPASTIFGVGYAIGLVGQSWVADLYGTAMNLASFGITQDANRAYTQRAGVFSNTATQLQAIAEVFVELSGGYPCVVLARGIGGTSLDNLNPGSTNWFDAGAGGSFLEDIAAGCGQLTGFAILHGHADIAVSEATYKGWLDDCLDHASLGLKVVLGRTGAQIATVLSTLGRDNSKAVTSDTGYSKIRTAQHDWAAARAAANDNVRISHTDIDLTHVDALHTNAASNTGTIEYLRRTARSLVAAHGFAVHDARGVRLDNAAAVRNGTVMMITPTTAMTGTGPFSGWQETINGSSWADVADLVLNGDHLEAADRGQVGVRHGYGDNPDISNLARSAVKAHSSSSVNLPVEPTYSMLAVTAISPASGASSSTTEGITAAGEGTVVSPNAASGTSAAALEDVTATGEGSVASPPAISGSSSATTGDVDATGEGQVVSPGTVAGSSSDTLEDVTASGAGTVVTAEEAEGASDATSDDVTASGAGTVAEAGQVALFEVDVPAARIFESLDT